MAKIRLLLADDHAILRAGLRALLNAEPDLEVVGEASDGPEAVARAQELKPDVALVDISMPLLSGLEATRQIRKRCPETKVLILTMHGDEEYLFQALHAGASGYILKRLADAQLIDAIREVCAGSAFLYPSVAAALAQDYLQRVSRGEESASYDGLTDREREVLTLIAEGHTNQEIADILVVSVKTVETHRSHIMDKLGFRTRAELVRYALRKGLLDLSL
ncbi:MAG: response regulator transcription factor [Chloroflexi bacterium]|nr:response regulator transcription factor [Chloroflexota bacterium]